MGSKIIKLDHFPENSYTNLQLFLTEKMYRNNPKKSPFFIRYLYKVFQVNERRNFQFRTPKHLLPPYLFLNILNLKSLLTTLASRLLLSPKKHLNHCFDEIKTKPIILIIGTTTKFQKNSTLMGFFRVKK